VSEQRHPIFQRARHREAGRGLLDDKQRDPAMPGAAGAHGGGHEVGPHAGGDVELRAVDHPGVAVADRPRADGGDVRAAVGLGDAQRADHLAGQGRADELLDQCLISGRDDVRQRDPVRQQRRDQPARAPGGDDLLRHQEPVDRVAAAPADLLRVRHPEQPHRGRFLVQLAGHLAVALPAGEMRHDLGLREVGDQLPQRPPLAGLPGMTHDSPSNRSCSTRVR